MKIFDSFKKKAEKCSGGNDKKVSDIKELEIYSGMRVVVEDPEGKLLFIAKLQEPQRNTAELYQYSEAETLRKTETENIQEISHMFVKLRGYNDRERKAVFMEGIITPIKKHVWQVENLIVTKVENERSFSRFAADIDAVIISDGEDDTVHTCKILNISVGGANISSEHRYYKGDQFLLKVKLLEKEQPFVVYCEVLRVIERDMTRFEYGCHFVELTEVKQEQISQSIERFAEKQ